MNAITKRIVVEVAKAYPGHARKNDHEIRHKIMERWWGEMIDLMGMELKINVEGTFVKAYPHMAGRDGYLDPGYYGTEIEFMLDELVVDLIEGIVEAFPDLLQLSDYGDLPRITVEPQLEDGLFDEIPETEPEREVDPDPEATAEKRRKKAEAERLAAEAQLELF